MLGADISWPSAHVATGLDAVVAARGAPQRVILDNGPAMVAKALDGWAYARGVELACTRPATPVDNWYVESFHDKFRDECSSTQRLRAFGPSHVALCGRCTRSHTR